jgi:hypothetical protein
MGLASFGLVDNLHIGIYCDCLYSILLLSMILGLESLRTKASPIPAAGSTTTPRARTAVGVM